MSIAVQIEPVDVLLFRDGKPFSAGSDHSARSIFPPFPTTFTGFIRSRLYLEAGKSWTRAKQLFGNLGGPQDYGDFRMLGVFLRKRDIDFVPVPRDCVKAKDRAIDQVGSKTVILAPALDWPVEGLKTNFPRPGLRPLRTSVRDAFEAVDGFVSLGELFSNSLLGRAPREVLPQESFVEHEERIAIGLDRQRRVASDQLLFSLDFLRLKSDVSFLTVFEGVQWPGISGLDALGGERRPVRWTTQRSWMPPPLLQAIAERVADTGRFKLVLLTPAIFDDGWVPGRRLAGIMEAGGLKARLVSALIERPVFVGGFDLAANRPKPIRSAVPAGSVYFYETESGDPVRVMNDCNMRAISDWDWQAGMGIAAVGTWSPYSEGGYEA